ncbi:MAG: protein kinase [Chitinophagaceae bacterium]
MQAYKGLHSTYTTGREIGRGGEGQVLEVREDSTLVAKIYSEPLEPVKRNKLQYMVSMQQSSIHSFAAWPKDLLFDASGVITGFTMRRLDGYVPLHMLFSPLDRKKMFPDKGYNFLSHVARNLATALHQLHTAGIVIGDINEGNILVDNKGFIAFIDCDSFQLNKGSQYYYCEVGITRYTPPELLERGSFENVVRTINTDSFSLSILLFQLLFMGRHPYAGRNLSKEDIDEEKAIRTGEFAYSLHKKNKKLSPPLNSLDIHHVPDTIVELLHQAFEQKDNRPLPAVWAKELDTLTKNMAVCQQSKLHTYPNHLKECPWCFYKNNRGPVYFLDESYLKSIPELQNIEQFINGFKVEQLKLKKLPDTYNAITGSPAAIGTKFRQLKTLHYVVFWVLLITALLLVQINPIYTLATGILLLLFNSLSPWRKKIAKEANMLRDKYQSLNRKFLQTVELYNTPPELTIYNNAAEKITTSIRQFRNLPHEFQQLKKQAEEKLYNTQLHGYLQQFHINNHTIPTFGPAKKASLYKHGIINAAHISSLNNVKITGIGPKNIQVLLTWQRQVATGFTYIPDYKLLEHESILVTQEIARKKSHLEHTIQAEYKNLHYNKSQIMGRMSALEKQYEVFGLQSSEALIDYEAFRKWAGMLGK